MGAGEELRFNGKVAIVTGAGGGLGKEYALLLASRGASVVVNDLGGSAQGEGSGKSPADKVVEEIRSKGGKAVADYNSVEDGEKIVQTALDNFGKIDIVINNAGILRDRSFVRTSNDDWDLVHRVHLRGSFMVTRAAWPHLKKQNYGRIIMTSSQAGICGNFGQANYSAAKLGLVGLARTLSIEGEKSNIYCNVIVPMAGSRLTEGILPPELFKELKPEYIAPVVAWLCHESCPENGSVIEAAGGWAGCYRWQRSPGTMLRAIGKGVSIEDVKNNWEAITDMTEATHPSSIHEVASAIGQAAIELPEPQLDFGPSDGKVNIARAKAHRFKTLKFKYSMKDAILYALALGMTVEEPDNLKFVYEGAEEFHVLPTFGNIIAQQALTEVLAGGLPGFPIDLVKVLHGEQFIEVLKPIPSDGTLESRVQVTDILDKGSGALLVIDVTTSYQGEDVMRNQFAIFIVGAGKFGGERTSQKLVPFGEAPKRPADFTAEVKTQNNQAALYRLTGDVNPLHIDPGFAAMAGFDKPILHGLCSYGITAWQVIKKYAGNDVTKFKAFKGRLSKPVMPGQTLAVDMWKDGNRIYVDSKVKETGVSALKGYIDLTGIVDSVGSAPSTPKVSLASDNVFEELSRMVQNNGKAGEGVNGVFLWNILKNKVQSGQWTLDLKNKPFSLYKGPPKSGNPDTTLALEDEDVILLIKGQLAPQVAFMKGRLKISGNIMLSQKLQPIFKQHNKL